MLILSLLNILLLLSLLLYDRRRCGRNVFSPGALFVYFAILPAISNIYFSINQDAFEELILGQVATKYHDYTLVYLALVVEVLLNAVTYISIQVGVQSKPRLIVKMASWCANFRLLANSPSMQKNHIRNVRRFGLIVYIVGVALYLSYLSKIGGLAALWANMSMRSALGAGLGYYHTASHFALYLGGGLIFYSALLERRYLVCFFTGLLTFVILASLGARGPGIVFLVSLFIMSHYKYKRVRGLVNAKTMLLGMLIPVFVLVMLQFRQVSDVDRDVSAAELISDAVKSAESGFLARIGRLERDVVVLGYFEEHAYWYGASYLGILSAPIPRTMYPDKPPVDTGMYLRSIALGRTINPPEPVDFLDGSGWPENNMAGYMNFGFPGLLLLTIMAGILYGKLFKSLQLLGFPIVGVVYFSAFFSQGPLTLSPKGLVVLLSFVAMAGMVRIVYVMSRFMLVKPETHVWQANQ